MGTPHACLPVAVQAPRLQAVKAGDVLETCAAGDAAGECGTFCNCMLYPTRDSKERVKPKAVK